MSSNISKELLEKLESRTLEREGKIMGSEILFRCPIEGHDDVHPSATYNPSKGIWFCHVCQKGGGAIDLAKRLNVKGVACMDSIESVNSNLPSGIWSSYYEKDFVQLWPYFSADKQLIGYAVRYEDSFGKKVVLPFFEKTSGKWKNKAPKAPSPLFGLDRIAEQYNATVWVTEGEKAAESIRKLGGVAVTSQGGSGAAHKGNWTPLAGRKIVIWRDNDSPGLKYQDDVLIELAGLDPAPRTVKCITVENLNLPPKGDAFDWLSIHADAGLEDLQGLPMVEAKLPQRTMNLQNGPARVINKRINLDVNKRTIEFVKDARNILIATNEHRLDRFAKGKFSDIDGLLRGIVFQRSNSLVRVISEENSFLIQAMKQEEVAGWMRREIEFGRDREIEDDDGNKRKTFLHADPPSWMVKDVVSIPPRDLPCIRSISRTPYFDKDGMLVQRSGYSKSEGILFIPSGDLNQLPQVDLMPNDSQVAGARSLILDELIGDFPFATDADRAHFVAALLLPFVRLMISGPTPMHLIEAASQGSGKTLLANVMSLVTTGSGCAVRSFPDTDAEMRKLITAELLDGAQMIVFDNLKERRKIESPALAAALTTTSWKDRHLGENRTVTVHNGLTWIATGNNPLLSKDLIRRCIRCRIDPGVERPELRSVFRHDPLVKWITEKRSDLVHSILVIVQRWIVEGCQPGKKTFGAFDAWARVIGGILNSAGIPGFLDNIDKLYNVADDEWAEWAEFFSIWRVEFGRDAKTPTELLGLCEKNDLLINVIGDKSKQSQVSRLGRALKGNVDRIYGGYRLELTTDEGRRGGRKYSLRRIEFDPTVRKGSDSESSEYALDYDEFGDVVDEDSTSAPQMSPQMSSPIPY